MEKVCENCLNKFITNRNKRKFCSKKCSSRAQFPLNFSNCCQCDKEFIVTVDRKKFCSSQCYFLSQSKKFIQKTCPRCNTSFTIENWKEKTTNYCSKKCMYNREAKGKYRKKAFATLPWKCAVCPNPKGRLEVHHIDFDRSNNNISNLQVICHGCHLRVHALIKRSKLDPTFCMQLLLNTQIFKLTPQKFVKLWKDAEKGVISFSIDMNLDPYI